MIIANEEVKELIAEIPEGHKHLRTTIALHDGTSFTFQEATIANLVRAYITIKTHPSRRRHNCPERSSMIAKKATRNGSWSRSDPRRTVARIG